MTLFRCSALLVLLFSTLSLAWSAEPSPLLTTAVSSGELSSGEKDTLYIGELKVQPSVIDQALKKGTGTELRRIANSLDTQFISALNATRVFQLVERKRKGDIKLEQDFSAVAVNPEDTNTAKAGMMAGAKFAFLPQIDGFQDKTAVTNHEAIGRSTVKREIFLSAVVQIVDTTTGKILPDSPSAQLTHKEEQQNVRPEELDLSDASIVALAKEVAKRLSLESVSQLRPAKVLAVTGKQVLINRGSDAGFSKGDLLEIFAAQNVKDDDTGETFRNEVPVGQAIISRIDRKQSYANITGEDLGIIKGSIVRFARSAAERQKEGAPEPDPTKPDFEKPSEGDSNPASGAAPLKWK